MVTEQISAADIRAWNSLDAIADSLVGRGLELVDRSDEKVELAFTGDATACIMGVEESQSPESVLSIDDLTEQFDLIVVATWNTGRFDLYSKPVATTGLGQTTIVHLGFEKSDLDTEARTSRRLVERLNQIDGYDSSSLSEMFDDEYIIESFAARYQELVDTVAEAIDADPDVSVQARRRYGQRLINRLVYLYLLQHTGVLPETYLEQQQGPASVARQNVYEEFYSPLFDGDIPEGARSDLRPYLQTFLFEETPSEAADQVRPPASTPEANKLFSNILKFLADWNWQVGSSYDIRHTTSVTPRVIGHALERFINKQHTGAYHTPDQLRHSLVINTLRDSLLKNLNREADVEYESLDQLFESDPDDSEQDPHLDAINQLYFEVLPKFRIIDPAVGSGSFIQEAQAYLSDVYTECLQHLSLAQIDAQAELPAFDTASERAQFTRLLATRRNLFGVDLNPEAIELTRFRLQLSVFDSDSDEPLHELRAIEYHTGLNFFNGNSLIGFVDRPNRRPDSTQINLSTFSNLDEEYRDLVWEYRQAVRGDIAEIRNSIKDRATEFNNELTEALSEQFASFLEEESHTVRIADEITPFHWWVGFPNIMADGGFDAVISNPPWQTLQEVDSGTQGSSSAGRITEELDGSTEGERGSIDQQRIYFEHTYEFGGNRKLNLSGLFIERAMEIAAPTAIVSMLTPGALFREHSFKSTRRSLVEEKELQQIIGFENHEIFPDIHRRYEFGLIQFNNSGTTDAFRSKFRQTSLKVLSEEESSFPVVPRNLLDAYSPSLLAFPPVETQDDVEAYETIVQHQRLDSENGWEFAPSRGIHQTRQSETLLEEPGDYPVYRGRNIYQYTYDSTYFDIDSPKYWGVNEGDDRASAKSKIRNREIRGLTQRYPVNRDRDMITFEDGETIPVTDVPMPYEEYRIAYRDIATSSNERTVIAAVLPPNVLNVNTIHTVHPYTWQDPGPQPDAATKPALFEPRYNLKELFCLLGILNSTPFDYLLRSKIETHLSNYLVTESQAPKPPVESDIGEAIWKPAARLNCYGEHFQPVRAELNINVIEDVETRADAQASIDAVVFHAYGFEDPEAVWSVLESLPRVRNPRILDEEYFDTVIRQFEQFRGDF
ncbi:Eco57I restriction-modification methylase domain-containing protein [Halobacteria archaeon AArc-dxtr1]|nr:Eco57I restriction-modification methylase domain-containing protein [Halobacteria archaeon AArc-dxtr1]